MRILRHRNMEQFQKLDQEMRLVNVDEFEKPPQIDLSHFTNRDTSALDRDPVAR